MVAAKKKQSIPKKLSAYRARLNYVGLLVGLLFFCMSLLPSLLPRPWLYQALISGIVVSIGYGIGVAISSAWRWFGFTEIQSNYKNKAWLVLYVVSPLIVLWFLIAGAHWQNQVRELVGEQPQSGTHMIRILVVATLVFMGLVAISRAIRRLNSYLRKIISKWLPRRLALVVSLFAVTLLLYWLVSGVIFSAFVDVTNSFYADKNSTTEPGVTQPISSYRSGSPESLIAWSTLGYQGRTFVARGPSQQQLKDFSGSEPKEQIRIYAGLESAVDTKSRAELVVKELERTGAFNRKVLIVATATGTGWLEPQSVDSIEYMYGGDSAIVSQQYSYLPSWISFLVDKQKATDTGQALFDAVYGKWASLPADQRPKLIPYGLSLGSFGGQAAFTGINGIKYSTDGALFMGTPSDTQLWMSVTNNRDAGSPEWQPTYKGGQTVRFAATNNDITKNSEQWQTPRVLYMQHASDPVVWFSFSLPLHQPDWLKETRGPDVSPKTHWYPFVTFFQVTVDQFFGVNVPNGHGHNYGNTIANAWAAVVAPEGWTQEKTDNLQTIINTY